MNTTNEYVEGVGVVYQNVDFIDISDMACNPKTKKEYQELLDSYNISNRRLVIVDKGRIYKVGGGAE